MRIERQIVFWVAALLVFGGLLWLLHHILLPFVAGAALAYLLDPLANRLTKRGMSRLVAALVILGGFRGRCSRGCSFSSRRYSQISSRPSSQHVPGLCAPFAVAGHRCEPALVARHRRQHGGWQREAASAV